MTENKCYDYGNGDTPVAVEIDGMNFDEIPMNDEVPQIRDSVQQHNGFANPLAAGNTRLNDPKMDQIEVSLVEEAGAAEPGEVLTNATDFLVEHNENYGVSWEEASHRISEVGDDPSCPPRPGWNVDYVRFRLRRVVESLAFRAITMILIITDLIVVLIDLSTGSGNGSLRLIDLILTVYFVVEICLRITALTQRVFFAAWYNVVDFAVVFTTFIIVVTVNASRESWLENLALLTLLRFVRVFRLIRLYTEKQQMETAARQLISQNKRRYQQDGFDLDLTYVTSKIIATSFPSTGWWAFYRNPIEKVAAFLDAKHPGKYRLYNLCSERTYETKLFHDRVERIKIDDHNVPSLQDMQDFAQSVKTWLQADPENVIVVHCKGGKGRTGTMICVWLVESGVFSTADQSLDYFGQRRTDTNVGKKFQGVETPSQSRYVGYYETIKTRLSGQLPGPCPIVIKTIEIRGLLYVGAGDGSDLWLTVSQGRDNVSFEAVLGVNRNCQVEYSAMLDLLTIKMVNCPALDGDVRVMFLTSSKTIPTGYESCPFYFWFNTALASFDGKLSLEFDREQLDNPHKPKTWHCFRENFKVTLTFDKKEES